MKEISIEVLTCPTLKDLENINALLPQIAKRPRILSMSELLRVVNQKDNCKVVVARASIGNEKPIVGMAVVTLLWIPTGSIAMVEDVVVTCSHNEYSGWAVQVQWKPAQGVVEPGQSRCS